ncbi:MAG: hypothetical protein H0U57_04005 [Tatlockia sp.]|nr:hypothetical protein [Tatlockia sp.]
MAKTDKEIELDELNKKNLMVEQERLAKEESDKILAAQQINVNAKKLMPEEENDSLNSPVVNYNLKPEGVWKEIIDDYEKEDYAKPRNENGALIFPGPDEAKKFFTEQAGKNREFLTTLIENGKSTDFHHFSCGSGKLYTGSYQSIHNELTSDLKAANGSDKAMIEKGIKQISSFMQPQPAPSQSLSQSMKARMQGFKAEEEKPKEGLDQEKPDYKSPSPLSTSPKLN